MYSFKGTVAASQSIPPEETGCHQENYTAGERSLFCGLDLDDFSVVYAVVEMAELARHSSSGVDAVQDLVNSNKYGANTANICAAGIKLYSQTRQSKMGDQPTRCRALIRAVMENGENPSAKQRSDIACLAIYANAEWFLLESAREVFEDHNDSM
jgi:hypothetical protein